VLERTQTESADKYDKLASKFEALSRQKQATADGQTQHDEALKTLRAELQSAHERLAQAGQQADSQAKQLVDLQRAVQAGEQRVIQLDELATARERDIAELHEKWTAAEARASQDADKASQQAAQLTKQEAEHSEAERQEQAAQSHASARDGEYEALLQQFRALQARAAEDDAVVTQQLEALKADRDQLQAECALHRERAEREAADSVYDLASSRGTKLLRKLLEEQHQADPVALHEQMERFELLIAWSARWFVRHFIRAFLQAEQPVQVEQSAAQIALDLLKESQQSPARFPASLSEWAEANLELLGQLALCVAASTAEQVIGAMPAVFHAAAKAPSEPRFVSRMPGVSSSGVARVMDAPRPVRPHLPPGGRMPVVPAPMSSPVPPQSASRPSVAPAPQPPASAAPLNSHEQFSQDCLVSVKRELLRVSHQLAELQDLEGSPMTTQRLREGASLSEQALEETRTERWDYIRNPPPERKTPVCWVRQGVLLDEQSEQELKERATEKLIALSASLDMLKRERRR
ncbi:MAG TPA: hypothetical protein PLW65_30360, partial [Pseudomonadota bacterium]|nr:hypothetical protein [Pseudomonadota bacterium]